ncbi:MAG: S41 family peptidase [Dehalococcoidales bacterium]|nr:S41 family peptidase [Dehalococcoidales bacterium]
MPKKLSIAIVSIALLISLTMTFVVGCTFNLINPATTQTTVVTGLNLDLLKEARDVIKDYYVEPAKLDDKTLTEGAIKGMVDAIDDPYTAYMSKEMADMSTSDFQGQFEGIGATVGVDESDRVIIIAPFEDSPADKAGILPGDVVLEVDGKSMSGLTPNDAVVMIRGPKGTTVKLTVLHPNTTEQVVIEIVRATIDLNSVRFEMKGDIAYIKITQFTERTDEELIPCLKTISQNGAKGIIIDLRNNPGGLLDTVVSNVSHFVKSGAVVHVVDRDGNKTTSSVKSVTPKILDIPMVVMVNQYSASGSEVLSGALQDYGRALIAGTTTYGKGSVNTLTRLSDGSAIYITIARWQTPNEHLIEGKGIQPDEVLDFEEVDGIQWAIDYLHNKYS